MVRKAEDRRAALSPELRGRLKFSVGDIRCLKLSGRFDAVISLFDVMNYQTSNTDLSGVFNSVRAHLKPGGLFIFDSWYGPAVLTSRPERRVKRLRLQGRKITRTAEPVMMPNENVVEVGYRITVKSDKKLIQRVREVHRMRYLFQPEVEGLFERARLELMECRKWMSRRPAGFGTWRVYFIGRKPR